MIVPRSDALVVTCRGAQEKHRAPNKNQRPFAKQHRNNVAFKVFAAALIRTCGDLA
jgi:hypothetical protein